MATGIHHVTAITGNVQKNVDFYAGFLGLRLVKQTGGFEDAEQLHLFYGDRLGSPGSVVTFLVWQDGARGRVGLGQASEISFAIPPASIGTWLQRAIEARVAVTGPARELGQPVLRLRDPDGLTIKLVGVDMPATAPLPDESAPTRIHSVTILTADATATAGLIERFGYRETLRDGPFTRMESDRDAIDLRQSAGFVMGGPGTGTIDHVAFRAPDTDALRQLQADLSGDDSVTKLHDRKYFHSLYLREPMGALFEYASDGPGFTVDEAPEHLGERLFIPETDSARTEDLLLMLPQFSMPGEERIPMRDLPFIHRFHIPDDPDGSTFVLLHGTGGNETDLMPLAAKLNPRATLLGVRGRSTEEGMLRWFRRIDPVTYDQDDIRAEADAFAAFMEEAIRAYALDPARIVYLGYSNGANLLGAILRLHAPLIRRAILLRGIEVLAEAPEAELGHVSALLLSGRDDPYAAMAPALIRSLQESGAALDARVLTAGHGLTTEDVDIASAWLKAQGQRSIT